MNSDQADLFTFWRFLCAYVHDIGDPRHDNGVDKMKMIETEEKMVGTTNIYIDYSYFQWVTRYC